VGDESKTDYSNLTINLGAKSNSSPLRIIDSGLADSNSLGLGTRAIYTPNRLTANNLNKNSNSIVNNA
jgi:hypothetical protein